MGVNGFIVSKHNKKGVPGSKSAVLYIIICSQGQNLLFLHD